MAEHAKEPAKAAAISEAVKRLLDAPSRQAAPALAILLGETLADEQPVGAFFREAARLFADLDVTKNLKRSVSLLDRTLKVDLPETHAEVHLTFMPLEPKDPESPMDLTYLRPSKPTPSPTALNDRVSLGPIPPRGSPLSSAGRRTAWVRTLRSAATSAGASCWGPAWSWGSMSLDDSLDCVQCRPPGRCCDLRDHSVDELVVQLVGALLPPVVLVVGDRRPTPTSRA